jgi:hypothetical protein
VTAVVAIPWLVPVTTGLADARDTLVETLGVGVFLLIVLLGFFGWLIIRHALIAPSTSTGAAGPSPRSWRDLGWAFSAVR